ncbi:MAG: hypothetical protein ABEH77_08985 [Halobacteriaceae archaeon]
MPTAWLVERSVDDRGLVTLVYATADGERALRREQSPHTLDTVTAAVAVAVDDLEPVEDPDRRERYRAEAERMADRHDPDDAV